MPLKQFERSEAGNRSAGGLPFSSCVLTDRSHGNDASVMALILSRPQGLRCLLGLELLYCPLFRCSDLSLQHFFALLCFVK